MTKPKMGYETKLSAIFELWQSENDAIYIQKSGKLFREYLKERRAMRADPRGRKKTIYRDNCSGHLEADECSFELELYTRISRRLESQMEREKLEFIRDNRWQNKIRKDGSWSGKLQNPGKKFFLQLADDAVKAVNLQKDKKGMSYTWKAMIRCGLSLGIDGTWSIDQLYPHLREIISKHRSHFDGEVVVNNSET
ncbi:hypothetical protein AM587_10004533 [Phytophthora nicotianae]|uniref:Uncharacterized protein n=1 Tax=Phytophthora nicotianae TaxID=4792 RepID=A0A0W8CIV0_PHYNI|nr:hypothetical protein AM587_10004533 [Phytophthora nicotianae]